MNAVALSTELAAARIFGEHAPPMLTPALGHNAEQEKEEILDAYPAFTAGKRQVIGDRDREIWEYIRAGFRYFDNQKPLAGNMMRLLLGDAQYGVTPEGVIFVERRIFLKAGYKVDQQTEDALYPVNARS